LRRTCPRCGTINWIRARQCASCDQRFDTIGLIAAREQLRFVDRFTHRAQGIADLKTSEHAQSQQRMDQFWDEDRQRRAALAAQQAKQKQQEMRMMYVAIALMVIVIIGIIVVSLIAGRG
jgi:ABC-type transport system involved in cytochrome bd biosynthesis fused ATPase/permease subunit